MGKMLNKIKRLLFGDPSKQSVIKYGFKFQKDFGGCIYSFEELLLKSMAFYFDSIEFKILLLQEITEDGRAQFITLKGGRYGIRYSGEMAFHSEELTKKYSRYEQFSLNEMLDFLQKANL